MGIVRMGPPTEIILKLKKAYGIRNFIETGTYYGNTAYWASQVFEKVVTIEYSEIIYKQVKEKYSQILNIEFLYGDTRNRLREIVSQLDAPSIFWLDAHWSGGSTYGEADQCPLIKEIEIINSQESEQFILIDDARLFLSPPPEPNSAEQWPEIKEVLKALKSKYVVIIEDVIIAVPSRAKQIIVQYCQEVNGRLWSSEGEKEIENQKIRQTQVKLGGIKQEEVNIIEKIITDGNVVLDVGANIGSWTKEVLKRTPDVQMHLFEAAPKIYQNLLPNLAEALKSEKIYLNNLGLAAKEEMRRFYYYEDNPSWSTFHRRVNIEENSNIKSPKLFPVLTTTLDKYVERMEIGRINFVKIDTEGGELEVIYGARQLLQDGKIDYVQFEYGGTFLDAKITLKQIFEYLQGFRYLILKILPNGLEYLPLWSPEYEDYQYSNFLAVNDRFSSMFLDEAPKMLDLQNLCRKNNVTPHGIIHIGAHEGKEMAIYQAMGVERVLFVEANPVVFERLQAKIAGFPNVEALNYAVSNHNGTVALHITSIDQSSSILPLKRHVEVYPQIKETGKVIVQSRTLDTLLQEQELNPADFNILNIDIQGAELLALQGATNILKHIEAINTEVNYEELYEGCALIDELDEFLEMYEFERVATTCPYHPSWGDAFYVVKKPVITMSTLGINGRFANQIFQYAFLKIYAKEHNLRVETPKWIGQYLFGHEDPSISQQRRVVQEQTHNLDAAIIPNAKKPFKNVDFWGYFQYNTKYYAPHKEYFRSLFEPVEEIKRKMTEALSRLREKGKTIVALHLRRGDYGYGHFFVAPSEWYKEWLQGLWEILTEPVLYIASDEPEKVLGDFAEYNPVTAKDLGVELPSAEFYPDFYILSQADVVAISNSSFSFAACMLNEKSKIFFRPHLPTEQLIPFDPWNSETIFRDAKVENYESAAAIADSLEGLKLSEVNLIIFPNWEQSEESLYEELAGVIKSVVTHPDHGRMTLLVETSDIDEEDANLILSGVIMNLLLSEELDVRSGPEISLLEKLSERQWEMLLGCIHARIWLENENQMAVKAENIRSYQLDSLAEIAFDEG